MHKHLNQDAISQWLQEDRSWQCHTALPAVVLKCSHTILSWLAAGRAALARTVEDVGRETHGKVSGCAQPSLRATIVTLGTLTGGETSSPASGETASNVVDTFSSRRPQPHELSVPGPWCWPASLASTKISVPEFAASCLVAWATAQDAKPSWVLHKFSARLAR